MLRPCNAKKAEKEVRENPFVTVELTHVGHEEVDSWDWPGGAAMKAATCHASISYAALPIWLSAHTPRKAAKDCPSAWASGTHQGESHEAPDFHLTQPWLLWPLGVVNHKWKFFKYKIFKRLSIGDWRRILLEWPIFSWKISTDIYIWRIQCLERPIFCGIGRYPVVSGGRP